MYIETKYSNRTIEKLETRLDNSENKINNEIKNFNLILNNLENKLDEINTNLNLYKITSSDEYLNLDLLLENYKPYNGVELNLTKEKAHLSEIYSLEVLKNDDLVSSGKDNLIKIWDSNSLELKKTLSGHTGTVYSLKAISNNYLASGSSDRNIRIWNLKTGTSFVLSGHKDVIITLELLPNGVLASGSLDGTIISWNLFSRSLINTYTTKIGRIEVLLYFRNRFLLVGSFGGYLQARSVTNLDIVIKSIKRAKGILSIVELNDENVAIGFTSGLIEVWNLDDWTLQYSLTGGHLSAKALVYLPYNILLSCSYDSLIEQWDLKTRKLNNSLISQNGYLQSIKVLKNGNLASFSKDNSIQIWKFI